MKAREYVASSGKVRRLIGLESRAWRGWREAER